MSTGQPLVHTLSPAQPQGELGLGIMTISGRPPVQATVLSKGHQLEQQVQSSDEPSTLVTMAPTLAQPPEQERVGVTASMSLLWVSSSYFY